MFFKKKALGRQGKTQWQNTCLVHATCWAYCLVPPKRNRKEKKKVKRKASGPISELLVLDSSEVCKFH